MNPSAQYKLRSALEEHQFKMKFFLVRTGHVSCVSGLWLQGWLEVRRGPATRGEGPAGHKGEERAGVAAPRNPTAAGDPGLWPGDDCEFKAAMSM